MSQLYGCCVCGCTDIQQTSWTMVNTGEVLDEEGPTEQVWCPRCGHDVDRWVDVDALDPYEHETKRIDGKKFLMVILDDMQRENNMISEQVFLLFYEDKHDNDVSVYGDDQALKKVQLKMMEDPERAFPATVEMDQPTYNAIWALINTNEFQQGWDLFVKECAEHEVYLRIEDHTVTHSVEEAGTIYDDDAAKAVDKFLATPPFSKESTATGRLSSSEPNISNAPQADVHTEAAKKMFREQPDKGDGKKRYTKTICIDFDGVLHMYTSRWAGAGTILDGPVAGAMEFLHDLVHDPRFQPAVYSSRSKDPGGIEAMKQWIFEHSKKLPSRGFTAREFVDQLEFPTQKPAAVMTIDDRAYRFEGRFPSLDWLDRFKPWNKRHREADVADHGEQNEHDLDLAEEALDCISSCLVRYEGQAPGYLAGGGNYYFEPSTRDYLAGMFQESRQEKKEE